MIYPKFLKEGSTIGVPAPSDAASDKLKINKLKNAKKRMEALGYNIILSKYYNKSKFARSTSAQNRAEEVNNFFKDKSTSGIICQAGGEFLVEILPYIDYDLIKKNPKFIAGFSDPTGLLYSITTKCDIATFYSLNFGHLGSESLYTDQEYFLEILKGNIIPQDSMPLYEDTWAEAITGLEDYNLTEKVCWKTLDNKPAEIKGRIIGGCMDIIAELAGTKYDGAKDFINKYQKDGIIWYFDNCELSMEEVIRTLWHFNEMGYFKFAKGIVFGRFGQNTSCLGYDVKTCLKDSVLNKLNVPIIYDADISHKSPSLTIINGSYATIKVKSPKGTITQELI